MAGNISIQWVLNFANAIVGVGLLTMPYCFQQCGILLATLMVLGSGQLTKITCEFLLRAGSSTRRSTYEQLALFVYGRTGKLMCEVSTIAVTIGTLVAFQVVLGDLSPAIVTSTFGFGHSWFLRATLMFASCGLVLPLCLMRSVSSLAGLNTISMTFYGTFIFIVCCFSLPSFTTFEWWTDCVFWRPSEFFKCLPIILLSFNCQAQVFIFYAALPDPNMKTMIAIIQKAINLVNFFYVTVGVMGYIAFYKAGVKGNIMENMPQGFLTVLINLGFFLSVVVSFPLMCFPVRSSINSLLFADKKQGILHDVITNASGYIAPDKFVLITLGLVSSTLVVGILVPKIEVVLSITGSLAGSFICLVFPSALFVMAGAKDRLRSFGLGVLLMSGFFMITCTSTSLMGLMSGEPPPVPQDPQVINQPNLNQLVKTEPPAVKIATIAAKLALELTEKNGIIAELTATPWKEIATHPPPPPTNPPTLGEKMVETKVVPRIATKVAPRVIKSTLIEKTLPDAQKPSRLEEKPVVIVKKPEPVKEVKRPIPVAEKPDTIAQKTAPVIEKPSPITHKPVAPIQEPGATETKSLKDLESVLHGKKSVHFGTKSPVVGTKPPVTAPPPATELKKVVVTHNVAKTAPPAAAAVEAAATAKVAAPQIKNTEKPRTLPKVKKEEAEQDIKSDIKKLSKVLNTTDNSKSSPVQKDKSSEMSPVQNNVIIQTKPKTSRDLLSKS